MMSLSKKIVLVFSFVGFNALFAFSGVNAWASKGQCSFVMKNIHVGPVDACRTNLSESECSELGETDDNSAALFSEEECSAEEVLGYCDMGKQTTYYYEGESPVNLKQLEIGCGFEGGDWYQ